MWGGHNEAIGSSGGVAARYDYEVYGKRTKVSGATDLRFGYTGHYEHAASGLTLTWFRAYNPITGRWLSRDPIREKGGTNMYIYVHNNPIQFKDPTGLEEGDDGGLPPLPPPLDSLNDIFDLLDDMKGNNDEKIKDAIDEYKKELCRFSENPDQINCMNVCVAIVNVLKAAGADDVGSLAAKIACFTKCKEL